jgi:hypothetical protein
MPVEALYWRWKAFRLLRFIETEFEYQTVRIWSTTLLITRKHDGR